MEAYEKRAHARRGHTIVRVSGLGPLGSPLSGASIRRIRSSQVRPADIRCRCSSSLCGPSLGSSVQERRALLEPHSDRRSSRPLCPSRDQVMCQLLLRTWSARFGKAVDDPELSPPEVVEPTPRPPVEVPAEPIPPEEVDPAPTEPAAEPTEPAELPEAP